MNINNKHYYNEVANIIIMFIYVRSTEYNNIVKLGITKNVKDRESTYKTGEYIPQQYIAVYKLKLNTKNVPKVSIHTIDKRLKEDVELKKYHSYKGGGTEFYTNDIIDILEERLNIYIPEQFDKLTQEEINHIERKEYINNRLQDMYYNTKLQRLVSYIRTYIKRKRVNITNTWYNREYQLEIIKYGVEQLKINSKFYLELATGGGKSYIVYNIINIVQPDLIICFSPRIEINNQNSNSDYMTLLQNKYLPINLSHKYKLINHCKKCKEQNKRPFIVCCYQSIKKVIEIIKKYNNVFIWFDEAHWAVQSWVDKKDDIDKIFLLKDTLNIKNRIYTSASPNKEHIIKYPEIFGELYSPIKVFELIKLKWLCPIEPYVLSIPTDKVNLYDYMINYFTKFNSSNGFSFHSCRDNAYKLFKVHYMHYKRDNSLPKPFLLVGHDYDISDIDLDYKYRDIKTYQNTPKSIGYVVQKYTMGYDFNKLDYIIISDSKVSHEDIIQCIGRGLRPDGLGENKSNLNKKLKLMLPVYIKQDEYADEDDKNKYKEIINVLKYLIHNIGLEYKSIKFIKKESCNTNSKDKQYNSKTYSGENNIESVFLNLLKDGTITTLKLKDFVKQLMKENIHNRESYNEYLEKRPELNLPEHPYTVLPDFTWEQTYKQSPYYTKEECKKRIRELKKRDNLKLHKIRNPEIKLNKLDNKIPNQCLFRFYGGKNNNEYFS